MIRDRTEQFRERLRTAGFPEILCPRSVVGFELDEATGRFRLSLAHPVRIPVGDEVVSYDVVLTGILHPQRLWGLTGVTVGRGPLERILEVRTDERSTTLTFDVDGEVRTVPFEVFV